MLFSGITTAFARAGDGSLPVLALPPLSSANQYIAVLPNRANSPQTEYILLWLIRMPNDMCSNLQLNLNRILIVRWVKHHREVREIRLCVCDKRLLVLQ